MTYFVFEQQMQSGGTVEFVFALRDDHNINEARNILVAR